MQKSLFLSVTLCLSFFPIGARGASFEKGDFASFSISQESSAIEESYSVSITEARSADVFGVEQSWSEAARPPLRSWLSPAQMENSLIGFSREHAQKYFADCAAFGKIETVNTPAGTFLACTISFLDDPKNSYSVSPEVPFGIVRRVTGPDEQGHYQQFLLRSFDFGAEFLGRGEFGKHAN